MEDFWNQKYGTRTDLIGNLNKVEGRLFKVKLELQELYNTGNGYELLKASTEFSKALESLNAALLNTNRIKNNLINSFIK